MCRNGIENSCGKRNAEKIVAEGKIKVLTNVAHRCPTQFAGLENTAKIPFDECDPRRLNGDIGPGAHRDPDVGLCQCRGIVDSITGHGHFVPCRPQAFDRLMLVFRCQCGFEVVEMELGSDNLGRLLVIAGEHQHAEARFLQRGHRTGGRRFDRVSDHQHAGSLSIDGDKHHRPTFRSLIANSLQCVDAFGLKFFQQTQIAE